jgi:hypothetical protein
MFCVRFDGTKGWLWSDTSCNLKLNYICQHSKFKDQLYLRIVVVLIVLYVFEYINYSMRNTFLDILRQNSTALSVT